MKVLIVAKTHMRNAACIGGLTLDANRSVRLLQKDGQNHPRDTDLEIGQIWEIEYKEQENKTPPHIEDILVSKRTLIGEQKNLKNYLITRVKPWKGGIENLFDGLVRFTRHGSGYISETVGIPKVSTGYWLSDRPLENTESQSNKVKYRYDVRSITYVGFGTPIAKIPIDALIRVSLARWWKPDNSDEDLELRCYLQLSGWYL
jgi:hypothetical protein